MEFSSKLKHFLWRNCIWKCRLRKWRPSCLGLNTFNDVYPRWCHWLCAPWSMYRVWLCIVLLWWCHCSLRTHVVLQINWGCLTNWNWAIPIIWLYVSVAWWQLLSDLGKQCQNTVNTQNASGYYLHQAVEMMVFYIPWHIYLRTIFDSISRNMKSSWTRFPSYWPFERGINCTPVDSPHKGPSYAELYLFFLLPRTSSWTHSHDAGDLRPRRSCDVTEMDQLIFN